MNPCLIFVLASITRNARTGAASTATGVLVTNATMVVAFFAN
jgi:hypothetical protein